MNLDPVLTDIHRMVGTVQFFPGDELSIANIAVQAAPFIENEGKLKWLVDTFINIVGKWDGIHEFRSVYCSQFTPADGIEGKGYSVAHGFTPASIEAEHVEAAQRFKMLEAAPIDHGRLLTGEVAPAPSGCSTGHRYDPMTGRCKRCFELP